MRAAVKTNIKEEEKHPQEEERQTTATRTKSYRLEDIQEHWEAFRAERLAKGFDKDALLLKAGFRTDGHKILLQLANEALAPTFERMRFDLLHYLRNAVENDALSLDYEVIQMAKEKMLYTDKEKFDHLKRKYPLLQELQEKLRLDPEF